MTATPSLSDLLDERGDYEFGLLDEHAKREVTCR
jgi:hypothetical protein